MLASGEQGVPVAPEVHTVTVAPATGWPKRFRTMSSLREPWACAELGRARTAKRAKIANPRMRIPFTSSGWRGVWMRFTANRNSEENLTWSTRRPARLWRAGTENKKKREKMTHRTRSDALTLGRRGCTGSNAGKCLLAAGEGVPKPRDGLVAAENAEARGFALVEHGAAVPAERHAHFHRLAAHRALLHGRDLYQPGTVEPQMARGAALHVGNQLGTIGRARVERVGLLHLLAEECRPARLRVAQ